MNKTILLLSALMVLGKSQAQDARKLQVGIGYGPYVQNNVLGSNVLLSLDYRINSSYTLSQSSQFGFIALGNKDNKMPGINKHFSVLLLRDVYHHNRLDILLGGGLAYTNYNELYTSVTERNGIQGMTSNLRTRSQLSFPIHLEINRAISNSVLIGFRMGGQVPTHGRLFNYAFLNPVLKFRL